MIQAEFFFELVIILFDLPSAFSDPRQPAQGVGNGQIAEKVLDRFLLLFRPLRQQPDFPVRRVPANESVGGLYPRRQKA